MLYKALLDDVRRGVIGPVFAAIVATVITIGVIMIGIVLISIGIVLISAAIAGFPISIGVIAIVGGLFGFFVWYFRTRRYSE